MNWYCWAGLVYVVLLSARYWYRPVALLLAWAFAPVVAPFVFVYGPVFKDWRSEKRRVVRELARAYGVPEEKIKQIWKARAAEQGATDDEMVAELQRTSRPASPLSQPPSVSYPMAAVNLPDEQQRRDVQ